MSDEMSYSIAVNGLDRDVSASPDRTLLQVLRQDLGLTGTKLNCEQGECGACTVLLDGRAVNSCLLLAASAVGHEVVTIEGLAENDDLHPVQRSFIECDAAQCGYCTPGMVLSASALLVENASPSRLEIEEALAGNYCRCTGYDAILRAVKLAATKGS